MTVNDRKRRVTHHVMMLPCIALFWSWQCVIE